MINRHKRPTGFKSNLGKLMWKYSAEHGKMLTQSALAKATGLSRPTISKWVNGTVDQPSSKTVLALITFFQCSLAELIEIE